jgi:DNA primase
MSKYYPDRLLRALRNKIPIDRLITEILGLQLRRKDPLLRFRCPACHSFHTATHPKTNLARCFDCQKNFNPIDLVMAATQCGFVEAVELLKKNFQGLI